MDKMIFEIYDIEGALEKMRAFLEAKFNGERNKIVIIELETLK